MGILIIVQNDNMIQRAFESRRIKIKIWNERLSRNETENKALELRQGTS
jgi:hypothetical protein